YYVSIAQSVTKQADIGSAWLKDPPRGRASDIRGTGRYGISECGHSALIPTDLITLAHFSVSSTMSLPRSAGEPASAVPPRSASRALMLGSAKAALTSFLSLSAISAGVFLGAPKPNERVTCLLASRAVAECECRSRPLREFACDA